MSNSKHIKLSETETEEIVRKHLEKRKKLWLDDDEDVEFGDVYQDYSKKSDIHLTYYTDNDENLAIDTKFPTRKTYKMYNNYNLTQEEKKMLGLPKS